MGRLENEEKEKEAKRKNTRLGWVQQLTKVKKAHESWD